MPADDPRMAEHTAKLLSQMTWDWQPLEPMLDTAARVIPPGKALRRYQRNRTQHEKSRTGEGPTKAPLSESEQIASGAKSLMTDALGTLRNKFVEVERREDGRWARRKSQVAPADRCPHCGRHGVEDESMASGGARSEGLEPDGTAPEDDSSGVVVQLNRHHEPQAAEGKDEPEEAEAVGHRDSLTGEDVLRAVSELVSLVEAQGRRLDEVMRVAEAAKNQAKMTAMRVNAQQSTRRRTRSGQERERKF